jgi:hypothetical protein
MRVTKITVYKSMLFYLANLSIKGNEYEQWFKKGKVSCKLKNVQKLEMSRDQWTTAEKS